jgi:peptidoglycan L-alanyl-D-glutamate endopeptidase CwlK
VPKYVFGKTSRRRLNNADPLLAMVFDAALSRDLIDMTVTQSVRSKEEQNKYYREKKSKVQWPNSKHNVLNPGDKSKAVDVAPYVNGKASYNYNHCCFMAGVVLATARTVGVMIRWGGNWDMDGEPITDQDFQDLVHFELI